MALNVFPYPGKRRYTPLVYQTDDGGIVISNDVFGLTIRQFERVYKACLNRRKTQEQYIINLRYPDKTSDEYLEYLQDSTDCNKDYVSLTGNNLKENFLYEQLVNTAGTEIEIRTRQQLCIIQDSVFKQIQRQRGCQLTKISSGSLAEGLDLPGSYIDTMYVLNYVDVEWDARNIKHPVERTTLVMESDTDHPGFIYLRLIAGGEEDSFFTPFECFESTRKGLYLSVNTFVSHMNKKMPQPMLSSHGPCLSDDDQSVDYAFCLRSKYLPYSALPWAIRHRLQWPPNNVIDRITNKGCLLVPIGPKTLQDYNILWRVSFSVAEKLLVHSFNFTQFLCYCLLKLTLKYIVNTNKHAEGLLCSYFLKTVLFWVSEEVDIDNFRLSRLYFCFSLCLSKLLLLVNNCYCPNYFIPDQNMFLGKISPDNNEILVTILYSIKCDGIEGLIHNLYEYDNGNHRLLRTQRTPSFIMLDLLFYRIFHVDFSTPDNILQCLELLEFTNKLRKSKLSTFIVDICKQHHAGISQVAAQRLPTPTATTERYKIHKRYHRHLQDGIKLDAVSGWLLYASFYYVSGQFNVALRLTDYVLSRCSRGMIYIGCPTIHSKCISHYSNHVHSTMTLNDKMKMTVVNPISYVKRSSLIPTELQLEVKEKSIFIPPIVLSHCLRFLCYHHIGDISKRQQSLHDLNLTVERRNLLPFNSLSDSKTILGVCFEISDDKKKAYQCYDEALVCDNRICATAKTRISNLSMH
ncbi:unnamed protein product [Mytilus coruscus]|uniref:Uncharacterized protein n=1 Tax=Mytilus coruscus TaxID=42192 RepID=A0A6J8EYC7_MYTCO|nr:unnamed protein product [Mytilus coruscus]